MIDTNEPILPSHQLFLVHNSIITSGTAREMACQPGLLVMCVQDITMDDGRTWYVYHCNSSKLFQALDAGANLNHLMKEISI